MNLKKILLKAKNRITTLNGKYSISDNANPKKFFLEEKEKCEGPFYHIMGDIKDLH